MQPWRGEECGLRHVHACCGRRACAPPSTTAQAAEISSYLSRDERDALREVKPGTPCQALLRKEADLPWVRQGGGRGSAQQGVGVGVAFVEPL